MNNKFLRNILKKILPVSWIENLKAYYYLKRNFEKLKNQMIMMGESIAVSSYSGLISEQLVHSEINQHELKVYSQNGEDGILLYLFSIIGTTTCSFIEFGIGDGKECNTANLSINFGWSGLLMDSNKDNIKTAKEFYSLKLNERAMNVKVKPVYITRENINETLVRFGFEGEIDLLSIDIDGNDYWVWEAINVINPRVVVIEYNAVFGPSMSLSVEYDPCFNRDKKHDSQLYFGASLTAFVKLGEKKGYALIGCDKMGVNAFFARKDLLAENLKEISPEKAYYPLVDRKLGLISQDKFHLIKKMNYNIIR